MICLRQRSSNYHFKMLRRTQNTLLLKVAILIDLLTPKHYEVSLRSFTTKFHYEVSLRSFTTKFHYEVSLRSFTIQKQEENEHNNPSKYHLLLSLLFLLYISQSKPQRSPENSETILLLLWRLVRNFRNNWCKS